MKRSLVLMLFIISPLFGFEGPDYMLIGDLHVPNQKYFNLSCLPHNNSGVDAIFRNASLYGINSLNWNYAGARVYSETGAFIASFRSYGIKNLYSSTMFSLLFQKVLFRQASFGFGYSRKEHNYGENLYKTSFDIFSFSAGASYKNYSLNVALDNLAFKKREYNNNPELVMAVNWQANKVLNIYSSFFNDSRKKSRFSIGQDLVLHKSYILKAGLLSGPEVYFIGFEIVYKHIVFGYTYYDIGGLPDCSRLTLSYR